MGGLGGVADLGSGIARVDLSFKTYWESPKDTPFTTAVRNVFVRGAPSILQVLYDGPALQARPYHGNYGPQAGKQDAGAGAGSQGWQGPRGDTNCQRHGGRAHRDGQQNHGRQTS